MYWRLTQENSMEFLDTIYLSYILIYHIQVHLSGKYIPMMILLFQNVHYISPPSIVAILLAICLVVVMQQSRDSVFHDGDTPIQLGLPWQSHTPVSVLTLKSLLRAIGAIY